MKLRVLSICVSLCALGLATLSCGSKEPEEVMTELADKQGEWTHDQTEEACDLYVDLLKEQQSLIDQELALQKKAAFFSDTKAARSVMKERAPEIDSLRTRIRAKRAQLR